MLHCHSLNSGDSLDSDESLLSLPRSRLHRQMSILRAPLMLRSCWQMKGNLPILDRVVPAYNTVLNRNFTPNNLYKLRLNDSDFFDLINLDFPGMEAVKAAVLAADIPAAKSEYTAFRRSFLDSEIARKVVNLSERSDTYATVNTYLQFLIWRSIHPIPAIQVATEIGIAAPLFPEFCHSAALLLLVLRRYQWIVETFFHSDGFHKDRTLRSQVEAIADFDLFLHFQSDSQTGAIQASLQKQIEACIHLSRPDFSFPPLGDLPAPNFDALELGTMVDSGFRREDFPYPDTTSHALPETGCYVMRDNWKPDAQYLFFDAHPQESTDTGDTSRLSLYAHGRELMTGAVRVPDGVPLADDVHGTQWITTPVFDWLERWYALAPKSEDPQASEIHHKRAVFYLKGEYFVLHDLVLGEAAEALAQDFCFDRGTPLHLSADAGYAWTQERGRSNLFIGATETRDLTVALDGDTVLYRRHSESPMVLNTLLFPMRPDTNVHPRLTDLPVHTDADVLGTGFTLRLGDTTDTFLISDDGLAEMSAADITFVGEYLFLRKDPSDANFRFVMLNGRFLQVGSWVLADLAEPREHYVRM